MENKTRISTSTWVIIVIIIFILAIYRFYRSERIMENESAKERAVIEAIKQKNDKK